MKTANIGDQIRVRGVNYTIAQIAYADYSDRDGWMIEFVDTNNAYHYWKQYLDGGEFIPATNNNKKESNNMKTNTNVEMIKSYWMATMAIDETREQMEAVWATEEGMEDLMDWYNDEVEAGCSIEDMEETLKTAANEIKINNEKENNNMNTKYELTYTEHENGDITAIDGVGTVYAMINGRYYRTPVNGKKTRIGKDIFEAAINDIRFYIAEAETEESNTDEEVKEIAKKMAPKAKKTRKSKDIAYTYYADDAHTTALFTLTAKQVDFIRHLPDTCFWEKGLDSTPWTDVLCDEIGGQFAGKPMTVGAMISTLCEKGLAYRAKDRINNRTCTYMGLTEIVQAVAIDLGLN